VPRPLNSQQPELSSHTQPNLAGTSSLVVAVWKRSPSPSSAGIFTRRPFPFEMARKPGTAKLAQSCGRSNEND